MFLVVPDQRCPVCASRLPQQLMVVLLQDDAPAVPEQCLVELPLARSERRRVRAGLELEQGVLATEVVDPQVPFDGEAQYGSRQGLVVVVHLPDITQRGRGEPLRRFVACHQNAFLRVPAVTLPGGDGISQHAGQARECDKQAHVVLEQPGRAIQRRRFHDQALGPRHDDRQAIQRPEW